MEDHATDKGMKHFHSTANFSTVQLPLHVKQIHALGTQTLILL